MAKVEAPRVRTVDETAKLLRVNPRVIYGMIQRGELRGVKVGRLFRIPADEVEALLRGARVSSSSESDFDDEPLSAADLAAIRRGLKDIERGRTITLEELERKYKL